MRKGGDAAADLATLVSILPMELIYYRGIN